MAQVAPAQFIQRFREMSGTGSGVGIVVAAVLLVAIILVTVPLQIPELTLSLVGALVYSALQFTQGKTKKRSAKKKLHADLPPVTPAREWTRPGGRSNRPQASARTMPAKRPEPVPKRDVRQPSVAPVLAPTFTAVGWEAEVQELMLELAPTAEGVRVVQLLVERARSAIQRLIPEAEVTGFGCGKLKRGKAFGVAVPDVDIVVSASPNALVQGLQRHLRSSHVAKLDAHKLQKSAIRACTDQLVSVGGFKFRRSAFKGQEPKVTLLAPMLPGVCEECIPLDFSVNAATPLHHAALLTECGQLEPRAKELVLLVQRWARDRGISHAAKGHLPPYAWSLLTIYFLQVSEQLLPSLEGFEQSAALAGIKKTGDGEEKRWKSPDGEDTRSVALLFKRFVHFYRADFKWRQEAVSVRSGQRAAPDLSLPIHVALCDDGSTTLAPSIEDPFDVCRNLGSFLTGAGCFRLREELLRATDHCTREASLGELLEPWAPPEWSGAVQNEEAEKMES